MEITDILRSFEIYEKEYKRLAVDAALAQRELITPHLISVLQNVLQNPEKFADRDNDYFGHIYAFMLLGHFCEEKAHDVIVDLFSLPGDLPSDLFGDSITGDLPIVLLRTCGGNTQRIKDLILNKNAYDYCRGSALQALSYTLIEGYITREEILAFYEGLFTEEQASYDSFFHDELATCVCDLYPEELMETIEKAYEEELIHSGCICYDDFTRALNAGMEKCIGRLEDKIQDEQIDNIHDSMSWWACFNPTPTTLSKNTSIKVPKSKTKKNKTMKSKKKKKKAKASKKANRKK